MSDDFTATQILAAHLRKEDTVISFENRCRLADLLEMMDQGVKDIKEQVGEIRDGCNDTQ